MPENLFQIAITEILVHHGADVTDDPVLLRNLLRDYCTSEKCRREINVTVMCAKNGLLASIREPDDRTPHAARLSRFVTILQDDYGIELSLAQHVVGIWMDPFTNSGDRAKEEKRGANPSEFTTTDFVEDIWCPPSRGLI